LVFHFQLLDALITFSLEKFQLIHVFGLFLVKLLLQDVDLSLHEVVVLLLLLFATVHTMRLELHLLQLVSQFLILLLHPFRFFFQFHVLSF